MMVRATTNPEVRDQVAADQGIGILLRRIVILTLMSIPFSANTVASQPAANDPIRSFLQPLVENHTLAGTVTLVASKDRIVDVQAVGYRDLAARAPMRPDCLFWIASTSKPMTVTAFMTLVDEGKVNLDDPVEKYLPEFHGQMVSPPQSKVNTVLSAAQTLSTPVPAIHPIRVREILSHTSGLPFRSKAQPAALDLLPLNQAVRSFAAEPLIFQPGTAYSYSNEGINTAARIIEVVSGMSYEQFMQQRLFDPLGMKDTTFWPSTEQISRLAESYKVDTSSHELVELQIDQLTYPLNDKARRFPMPAGGLFSTAGDVATFCQMILNGGIAHGKRIVSEAAIREMTRTQNKMLDGKNYGLGWGISDHGFGHGGAYNNAMEISPSNGRILVFMVQQSGPFGTTAGESIVPSLERIADDLVSTSPGSTNPASAGSAARPAQH
jgi:CubicO group peptidase (beta-lactamase class C family)